jgi:SSS family solute:Na+ symporter
VNIYLGAIILYLSGLAVTAYVRSRRVSSGDDFLVASRSLPAHVLVFTLLSTWIGSGSLFGGAGLGYRSGFSALWQSAGAWAGIAIIFFLAPRVRRLAQYTVPDILEMRYGKPARILGTIVTVIAYTTIAAYQFRGGGRLLHLVADVDPTTGALITAAFCIAFTALAGMLSVAYLDVVNGLMMTFGVGAAVIFLSADVAPAALQPHQFTLFGLMSPIEAVALFLPTMALLLGEAGMYQKFFSAKSERAAKIAVAGWIAGTILVETLIVAVGVFGSAAIPGLDQAQSEEIVVRTAVSVLPTLLGLGLLLGAAAIIVSTASTMLLTPSTNLVRDVYQRFLDPSADDRRILLFIRLTVVALGVVGLLAGNLFPTILSMALWAYTMYGAGITPALLAALIWPRATPAAGVGSIAAGMIVTFAWEIIGLMRGSAAEPSYLLGLQTIYPALLASVGTLVALSLMPRGER